MIQLYTARDSMEAHYLRGLLEDEGIRATVLGETLGAARGEVPMTQETLPSVWVDEADVEAGMTVVDRLTTSSQDAAGPETPAARWTCPQCGRAIEPQFSECWACGAARPIDAGASPEADDPGAG